MRAARVVYWSVFASWISALLACGSAGRRGDTSDASWRDEPARPAAHGGWTRESFYLEMRDGVALALDVYLPDAPAVSGPLPTVLRQTRYWRRTRLRWPLSRLLDRPIPTARYFLARGYAWVDVDVRGSGASGGWRPHPWGPDEVADGAEILDWIVAQPWSNGRVGATGTSYDGTAAELLLPAHHPALRAVAPRFALFDVYADVSHPGGVHLTWFTETWGRFNRALDANDLGQALGRWVRLLVLGAHEVDDDPDRSRLAELSRAHRWNYDVHRGALEMVFRDDPARSQGGFAAARFSPHARLEAMRGAAAAVYSYSGWLDGAYANSAIKRHLSLGRSGDRLILGPWNHGGRQNIDPLRRRRATGFDHDAELLRFFDRHLLDAAPDDPALADGGAPVTYYTLVEGRWKHAPSWPPPADAWKLYLAAGSALAGDRPAPGVAHVADTYPVDRSAGTGDRARWNSLMGDRGPIDYGDRRARDARLLVYDTAPLDDDVEVTGHPLLRLWMQPGASDVHVFAYLEDVAPDGRVTHVTEGLLRALHHVTRPAAEAPYATAPPWWRSFERTDAQLLDPDDCVELRLELLPVSYLFRRGHRVRLALAGADVDHFPTFPGPPPTWQVHRDAEHPSALELPVVPRDVDAVPGLR